MDLQLFCEQHRVDLQYSELRRDQQYNTTAAFSGKSSITPAAPHADYFNTSDIIISFKGYYIGMARSAFLPLQRLTGVRACGTLSLSLIT